MKNVLIKCPACSKTKKINLDENIISHNHKGITTVNINKDQLCPHNIIVYIDNNLDVRDCFILDFELETPNINVDQSKKEFKTQNLKDIDTDLIKLNFFHNTLSFILRGFFFRRKILIINNLKFLDSQLYNFFNYIFNTTFEYDISIISQGEYEINKKDFKSFIVFEGNKLIRDKEKLLDNKKLKIERNIIHKFFMEYDPKSSLIILRNEIYKVFLLSKSIIDFIENLDKKEKINAVKLFNYLESHYNVKISRLYLNLLIDVSENNYNIKIPVIFDSFLGFISD